MYDFDQNEQISWDEFSFLFIRTIKGFSRLFRKKVLKSVILNAISKKLLTSAQLQAENSMYYKEFF